MTKVVVIGAGIGGLTTAAVLSKAGLEVDVLEAHIYPGGSAGTFYYQGFQFDAGATLAGGFNPDGPMSVIQRQLNLPSWPAEPFDVAMQVHLPNGNAVERRGDQRRWAERQQAFGPESLRFWQWQERTADAMWSLAAHHPPWPPANAADLLALARGGFGWLQEQGLPVLRPELLVDAFRPIAAKLNGLPSDFRTFIDAQLLISAQATSENTVGLYGAAALDLPRRGLRHFEGGMIGIARHIERGLLAHGGRIHYRHPVESISRTRQGGYRLQVRRKGYFEADLVVANLTPANLADLYEGPLPARLARRRRLPSDGWGAFTGYLGVDAAALASSSILHHQIITGRPLPEGNSVFLSISPTWDKSRAPEGKRALTLSTHTRLEDWWSLFESDRKAYEARKDEYLARMIAAAERAIPGITGAVSLALPGTPVTFQRFTDRKRGWVGGFPQTNLFRAWPSRLDDRLFMVGDSIFPGQSTAAVAMGGLRVGRQILQSLPARKGFSRGNSSEALAYEGGVRTDASVNF